MTMKVIFEKETYLSLIHISRVYEMKRCLLVERSLVAASHVQLCVLIVVYAACVAVHYISEYGVY